MLRVRCGLSLAEVRRTSLTQAHHLMERFSSVDGPREIVNTIVDLVNSMYGKPNAKPRTPDEAVTQHSGSIRRPEE